MSCVYAIRGLCSPQELSELERQARIYREQGLALQKEDNIDEALAYYQKAVIMDPGYAEAYNDIGIILEAKGEIEQAKYMYLKATEVAPDYPSSYTNLALLYEEQKDYAQAIVCWVKRAALGGSQDPWAETARRRLEEIARLYPEAYRGIGEKYGQALPVQPSAKEEELLSQPQPQLEPLPQPSPKLSIESKPPETSAVPKEDNRSRALEYLARAKENFAKGQYVAALKEATIAEYLDSANTEISAFVEKIRQAILR